MTTNRVLKIGGSLLKRADAFGALDKVLRRYAEERLVVIVGGGEAVDALRRLDTARPLGAEAAHWAAVAMMDANTRAVASWWPDAGWTDTWQEVVERESARPLFVSVAGFLQEIEPSLPGAGLPVGWQVTSDSIAARIAAVLDAELTLVKSCDASGRDWERLASAGVVDEFFPTIAKSVSRIELMSVDGFAPET